MTIKFNPVQLIPFYVSAAMLRLRQKVQSAKLAYEVDSGESFQRLTNRSSYEVYGLKFVHIYITINSNPYNRCKIYL